jgi:hypothetical protein
MLLSGQNEYPESCSEKFPSSSRREGRAGIVDVERAHHALTDRVVRERMDWCALDVHSRSKAGFIRQNAISGRQSPDPVRMSELFF